MDSAEKNSAFDKRLKRQVIGKPHRFLAVVPLGFEQTFVQEMFRSSQDTITYNIIGDGKIEFTAKLVEAWKIVAFSRIANRVLMHIADFKAENFRELEKKAAEIPWELFLTTNHQPLTTIHVTCKHSRLYHSDAVAERLQKVIEGGSRPLAAAPAGSSATPSPKGSTPNTPKAEGNVPPQNIYVTLIDDRCTVWLDLAGEELYKRGHERFVNDAPLKETIAAAMIFESISTLHIIHHQSSIINYPLSIALIDPMAGSGTFSLEATYMANGFIPGKCRDFALMHQPAFKPATWNFLIRREERHPEQREGSRADVSTSPIHKIITSDISEKAVEIIRHNASIGPLATDAPSGPAINPQHRDFFSYTADEIADACPGNTAPVIVLNPPYGKRLDFDAPRLYTRLGRRLAELARALAPLGKKLTVGILAPKDIPATKYTCTANLLRECPALDPAQNANVKFIVTSHGGLTLNAIFATI
ncbi:MAG: RNA methyltransferase [Fibrobacter sp.]|nr:RNA methyltransferase [Fibrobacter sp.]